MSTWEETKENVLHLMREGAADIYRYGKTKSLEEAFDELTSESQTKVIREALASDELDLRNVAAWLLLNSSNPWPKWLTEREQIYVMEGMRSLGIHNIPTAIFHKGLQAEHKRFRTQCALSILELREETLKQEIRTNLLSVLREMANNTNLEPHNLIKVIDALILMGGGDYTSYYIKLSKHPDSSVRKVAIQALLSCPKTKKIEYIIAKALKDPDPKVQCVAIEGVRTFSLCEYLADVYSFIEDENSMIRDEVKKAFQELAIDEVHLRHLLPYLRSSHVDVALWVMDLYSLHKCLFAVGPLKKIVSEGAQKFREECISSILPGAIITCGGAFITGIIFILVLLCIKVLSFIWSMIAGASPHFYIDFFSVVKYGLYGFIIGALVSAVLFILSFEAHRPIVAVKAAETIRLIKSATANK